MAKKSKGLERKIRTDFYFRKELVKTNVAADANRAVLHCVNHMQFNTYEATSAEVYDGETGALHCVVKRSADGTITILYRREVKESYT